MLNANNPVFGEQSSGLLECCNKQRHWQMLLHEDLEQLPEMKRNESKNTTDSCVSVKEDLFMQVVKKPSRNKVSLSERRNSMNCNQNSKKQTQRFSHFQQTVKLNCKMVPQMTHCEGAPYKKQNMGTMVNHRQWQNKASLRQDKQFNPNKPYLIQFSFMEDFCDKKGNILRNDKISIKRISRKNQPTLILGLKENNQQNIKCLNLKLGQNLPTYRSEFHNTNETFTKRSEVL